MKEYKIRYRMGIRVAELLPNKSSYACEKRAKKLIRPLWTIVEDDKLKRFYPSMGTEVADFLPDKTISDIENRVKELGLVRNIR